MNASAVKADSAQKGLSAKKEERHDGHTKESPRQEAEPRFDLVQRMSWGGERPSMEGMAGGLASMPLARRQSAVLSLQRSKGNRFVQRLAVQAKLMVGAAGDRYEQEANRVAEQVMRRIESPEHIQRKEDEEKDEIRAKPLVDSITPLVQRVSTSMPLSKQLDEDKEEVQTKRISAIEGFEAGKSFERQLSATRGRGSSLPENLRGQMEAEFGADFSDVRVHADGESAQLNHQLSAQAFTYVQDIYIGEGKSVNDKLLLAHELTHVVQQREVANPAPQRLERKSLTESISRQIGGCIINRWNDFEHKAFGDLAAQIALRHDWTFIPRHAPIANEATMVPDFGVSRRSSHLDKHKQDQKYQAILVRAEQLQYDLRNRARQDAETGGSHNDAPPVNSWDFQDIGIRHFIPRTPRETSKQTMSLGDASMLAGDFFKYAEAQTSGTAGLEQAESVNPNQMTDRMGMIAITNANHFFPLAGEEFGTHFYKARIDAISANESYEVGHKDEGNEKAEKSMVNLGFALHFLQDSFASGHQYPHAFEDVGSKLGTVGLAYWGSTCCSFHDALCALPNGLPIKYNSATKNFHGDDFAESGDYDVAIESYHALGKVLQWITGHDNNIPWPMIGEGPDVNQIMNDESNAEARTIWKSMMKYFEEGGASSLLQKVKEEPDEKREVDGGGGSIELGGSRLKMIPNVYTTSSETKYMPSYLRDQWEKVMGNLGEGPQHHPETAKEQMIDIALRKRSNIFRSLNRGSETDLNEHSILGHKVDISGVKQIVQIANRYGIPNDLTHNELVLVIGAMTTDRHSLNEEEQMKLVHIISRQSNEAIETTFNREVNLWDVFGTLNAKNGHFKVLLMQFLLNKGCLEPQIFQFVIETQDKVMRQHLQQMLVRELDNNTLMARGVSKELIDRINQPSL